MEAVIIESNTTVSTREKDPTVQRASRAATDTLKKTADALTSLPPHLR
jgi:hypothetical protein